MGDRQVKVVLFLISRVYQDGNQGLPMHMYLTAACFCYCAALSMITIFLFGLPVS